MHRIRIAPHAAEQIERDNVALEVRAQRALRVVHANRSNQEIAQRAGEDLRTRALIQHRCADSCSGQVPPDAPFDRLSGQRARFTTRGGRRGAAPRAAARERCHDAR